MTIRVRYAHESDVLSEWAATDAVALAVFFDSSVGRGEQIGFGGLGGGERGVEREDCDQGGGYVRQY